jgi:pimeloyl-ACP methyl ester carboxylesterase
MTSQPDTKTLRQQIRFVKATDGVELAWAQSGRGPTLVKAANWLTHLEYELRSPVWRHWLDFLSKNFRLVRYDERGCGMSGWEPKTLTLEQWAADLGSVIDAAQPEGKVILLGISQGAAASIHYALQHPDRVAALVLYGGYARGADRRNSGDAAAAFRAMVDLARLGWGKDNPSFRQVFTSRFIPGGTPEQLQWFNDLCVKTTTGEIFASLYSARAAVDVEATLPALRVPTLVIHSRGDEVIPVHEVGCSPPASPVPSSSSSIRAITFCSSTSRRGADSRKQCWRSCGPTAAPISQCLRVCRSASGKCWR